ncbi:DUF1611 domain-containing protein [Pseudothermotoga elfii]
MRIDSFFEPGTPAAILSWGQLGTTLAKTTYGLLRHSRIFIPVCVIAEQEGKWTADFMSHFKFNVPVVNSVDKAVHLGAKTLLIGIANVGGFLPQELVDHVLKAIEYGLDIVSGFHLKMSETEPFSTAAKKTGSRIIDVRHLKEELKIFSGQIYKSKTIRVCVLGTDCAVGKRTTAIQLWQAALERKLPAAFLATGQTGIMIGADEGVVIDAIASDFIPGTIENLILRLEKNEKRLIFIEGQGALRHPAYGQVALGLLYGCMPQYIVLSHDPARKNFEYFDQIPVSPDLFKEIALIKNFINTEILGISCLNSYCLDDYEVFNPFNASQIMKIISKLEVAL